MTQSDRILRITNADGSCGFASSSPLVSMSLSPSSVTPNPLQGTTQTFNATLSNVSSPSNTPILFQVFGVNPQIRLVKTNAQGQASFTYTGSREGSDTVAATTTINGSSVTSNLASVTWGTGKDTTFLTLNLSPRGGTIGQAVNVLASLTDVSLNPAAALANQTVQFALGSSTCQAMTNSNGIASCSVTPASAGTTTLTASFAGTTQYVASSASSGFNAMAPTPTVTPTPTPVQVTPTPTPTATPTPIGKVGPIYLTPPELDFGNCEIRQHGQTRVAFLFNPWWNNGAARISSISIQGSGDFSIDSRDTTCGSTLAVGRLCAIAIQFTPSAGGPRQGKLVVQDNASNSPQTVILDGQGDDDQKGRR